jgi:hypothetical protein
MVGLSQMGPPFVFVGTVRCPTTSLFKPDFVTVLSVSLSAYVCCTVRVVSSGLGGWGCIYSIFRDHHAVQPCQGLSAFHREILLFLVQATKQLRHIRLRGVAGCLVGWKFCTARRLL